VNEFGFKHRLNLSEQALARSTQQIDTAVRALDLETAISLAEQADYWYNSAYIT
jgi:hypothetical protein